MKPGKALLIITIVIVVLVLIAFAINQSNKKKTTVAVANQTTPDPNITGRYLAVSAMNGPDYTAIINGKPVWLWTGARGTCSPEYTKILSGPNAGWCLLNDFLNKSMPTKSAGENRQWCCSEYDTNGNCANWESRPVGNKCSSSANL